MPEERAEGAIYPLKIFERFWWPYTKRIVEAWHAEGIRTWFHLDQCWDLNLPYFRELPKGKVYLHLDERTNIFKAKEILGDHICLEGNLKPSLFTLGTPSKVEKETKQIIDKCAEGGGLIVGAEIPDDAKLKNIRAMINTCKTYGLYRN